MRIVYEPSWKEIEDGVSKRIPHEEEIINTLKQKREIDKIMNTTMSGPHRDKIKFVKDGMLFVPVASTGQRRLIALLLRISQAVFFSQITKEKPILLRLHFPRGPSALHRKTCISQRTAKLIR